MSLYSELKRRNVFRVALLYVVASWLLLQIADVGISLLDLPGWTGRFVFLLLVIGFPLAMVFSWVYEITPEGIKRETEVSGADVGSSATARKLDIAVIVLLVVAVSVIAIDRLIPEDRDNQVQAAAETAIDSGLSELSIAVLPFANMSADSSNEYFSDGLSEELLNLLAKIPELKVAARTSAFRFKDSDADIQEIADQLRVAHVLEGSVRRSGNSIRVTAQLIKAANGYHLWSESWDREFTEVFAIQDEIAQAVVDELRITLLGEAPRARVTDARAYELYLRAKAVANLMSVDAIQEASSLLKEALAIDPEFASAWVELGAIQTHSVSRQLAQEGDAFERSRASNRRALEIDPQDVRALAGLSWIAIFHDWNFRKAGDLIREARALEPNNVRVLNSAAALAGAFGQGTRRVALLEAAAEQDPLALTILHNLIIAYSNDDRLADAFRVLEDMRAIAPDSALVAVDEAWLHWFDDEPAVALDKFSAIGGHNGHWGRVYALHDLGRYDESVEALRLLKEADGRPLQLAAAYAYIGDNDSAFAEFDRAFEARDKWLIEIRGFTFLDSLHADPRWDTLLRKIGISDQDAALVTF